jgi:hypothetical protein
MSRKNQKAKLKIGSMQKILHRFEPGSVENAETWAEEVSAKVNRGNILIVFKGFDAAAENDDMELEVCNIAAVFLRDDEFPIAYVIDKDSYEMSFIQTTLSAFAGESSEKGQLFCCSVSSLKKPLTEQQVAELAMMETVYGETGNRKKGNNADPLYYFLKSIGVTLDTKYKNEPLALEELVPALLSRGTTLANIADIFFIANNEDELADLPKVKPDLVLPKLSDLLSDLSSSDLPSAETKAEIVSEQKTESVAEPAEPEAEKNSPAKATMPSLSELLQDKKPAENVKIPRLSDLLANDKPAEVQDPKIAAAEKPIEEPIKRPTLADFLSEISSPKANKDNAKEADLPTGKETIVSKASIEDHSEKQSDKSDAPDKSAAEPASLEPAVLSESNAKESLENDDSVAPVLDNLIGKSTEQERSKQADLLAAKQDETEAEPPKEKPDKSETEEAPQATNKNLDAEAPQARSEKSDAEAPQAKSERSETEAPQAKSERSETEAPQAKQINPADKHQSKENTKDIVDADKEPPGTGGIDIRNSLIVQNTMTKLEEQQRRTYQRIEEFLQAHKDACSKELSKLRQQSFSVEPQEFTERLAYTRKTVVRKLRLLSIEADEKLGSIIDEGRKELERWQAEGLHSLRTRVDFEQISARLETNLRDTKIMVDNYCKEVKAIPPFQIMIDQVEKSLEKWRAEELTECKKLAEQIIAQVQERRDAGVAALQAAYDGMSADIQQIIDFDLQRLNLLQSELQDIQKQACAALEMRISRYCDMALANKVLPMLSEFKNSFLMTANEMAQTYASDLEESSKKGIGSFSRFQILASDSMAVMKSTIVEFKQETDSQEKKHVDNKLKELSEYLDQRLEKLNIESASFEPKKPKDLSRQHEERSKQVENLANEFNSQIDGRFNEIQSGTGSKLSEIVDSVKNQSAQEYTKFSQALILQAKEFQSKRGEVLTRIEQRLAALSKQTEDLLQEAQ